MTKLRRALIWLAAFGLVAAACGRGGDDAADGVATLSDQTSTSVTVDGGSTNSDELALLAFTQCMREQGIDLPDPTVDANGNVGFSPRSLAELRDVDPDSAREAFTNCADLLEGVTLGFEILQDPEFQDGLLAFSACMRENGFDLPDPDFSNIASRGGLYGGRIDQTDPDFETAFEACQDRLPGFNIGTRADD